MAMQKEMSKLQVNPTELFTYEECDYSSAKVGCIVYSNCVFKDKIETLEPGTKIQQITVEVTLHLEKEDGTKILETQNLA